jgi:large repetitive protein
MKLMSFVDATTCQNVNLALAGDVQRVTCEVVNTYNVVAPTTGTITVNKVMINDDGGTELEGNFDFFVNDTNVPRGAAMTFEAGTYSIDEVWDGDHFSQFPDSSATEVSEWYDASVSCIQNGTVDLGITDLNQDFTLSAGDSIVCTITNNDRPATITVTKNLIVDNGSTDDLDDFEFFIDGNLVDLVSMN